MRPLLHVAACLALLPYLALAGFFLFVDRAAATKGLPELFEFVLAVGPPFLTIHAGPLDPDQVLFLAPCGLIVLLATWSVSRALPAPVRISKTY